jgi:integrase
MANIRVRKNKDGEIISYEIRVFRGRDENGKQLKPYVMTWKPALNMTAKQIERELNKTAVTFEEQCRQGYSLDNRQTFAGYAEYVIRLKERSGVKHTTIVGYRDKLVRINAGIGHIKIADIRPQHLNNFYEQLSKSGVRANDKKASCKTDLRDVLKRAGLTKEQLSKNAGVSLNIVTACYNKKPIRYSKAEAVANALNTPVDKLFDIIENTKPLSAKTIVEYHRLISTILAQAEKEMLIQYNPASKATPPKLDKSHPNYFQPEQVAAIREALEHEPLQKKVMVHLLLITGIRRGELAGLRWSQVDFERSQIHICHSILYKKDVGIYTSSPKTDESDRFIKLPKETMELLAEYRNEWLSARQTYGTMWNSFVELPDEESIRSAADSGEPPEKHSIRNDYLFFQETSSKVGYPLHPDTITGWCADFSRRYNLPHINPHAFRHTMASILYFNGIDTISISGRLGHAKPSTTSDLYSHIIKEADERSAECIAEAIFGSKHA